MRPLYVLIRNKLKEMKKRLLSTGLLIVLATTIITSCSKKEENKNSSNDLDRKPMLEHYANNYIIPAYADMTQKLNALKTSVAAFTTTPNATTLGALRTSYRTAYITWQKVDMLEFGPGADATLRNFINIYPASTTKVNDNISSNSYDLEAFGNKDAQGFPALDYLINGAASTDQLIVDQYTTDPQANNRKQYLLAIANKMLEKVTNVSNTWSNYKDDFINNTGIDVSSSLTVMVNGYVQYYERNLRAGKIGLPVGAMTGFASPQIVEAYYMPELSKELALTALNAIKDFYTGKGYNGTNGASMQSYLAALGTKDNDGSLIADVVVKEIDEAITALQNLNTTILNGVQNNRTEVLEIYEQLQDVVPLLKVDMVSAFSISITYVDNDGD
ncbi:MAG: imelysin family protein [Flavipsychrobacter sp.]